jgi:hypothetical protein
MEIIGILALILSHVPSATREVVELFPRAP